MVKIPEGSSNLKFDGFTESIQYFVESKGITSTTNKLEIVTRPQISLIQWTVKPPAYTRLPEMKGKENYGDIETLPGSNLSLTLRATKPLSVAWMLFYPSGKDTSAVDSLMFRVNGTNGSLQTDLFREGKYTVRLVDAAGHKDRDPASYRIRLLNDDYPAVYITFPDVDVEIGDEMILPLQVAADDDYGISKINLAYHRLNDSNADPAYFPLKLPQSNLSSVSLQHIWQMAELDLMPGDVVEYWAVAWDNDAVNGTKKSESQKRLVRLPSIEEIVARVEQQEQASFDQASSTLEAAKELREEVNKLVEEMRRNPEMDWERKRQVEEALAKQDQIQKSAEQLAQKLDEMIQSLEKHDLASMETLEKYMELQKLIAEVATQELKDAMEQLRKAMEEQDPDAVRQALEQFDLNREEFLSSIERSMNILKQLQLERRLDELVKQAEEILQRQEQSIDKLENTPTEQLKPEQENLAHQVENFENRLQEVIDLAKTTNESQLESQLTDIAQDLDSKNLPQEMRNTAEQLAAGNKDKSRSAMEQHARDLSATASQLSIASSQLRDKRKSELAQKLRRLVEDLLYLSREQEQVSKTSQQLSTQSPKYSSLSTDQEDLRRGLGGVANRLFDLSQETFFITPELGAALGRSYEAMEQALEGYTSRNPRSVETPQNRSLSELNTTARQILAIMDQLEGSSSSSGYEEMMEQLSQMASQQQRLNQQSMPMPGEGGMPQLPGGEQMSRLAAEQRALQQQMQQLSESGQGMREILGNLEEIANQMGEVANKLEDQNIDERTRRLQRQIVSRLLDATRSARQEEFSRKRESRSGQDLTRRPPPDLQTDEAQEQLRRDLMRALQEGYSRDYRNLIRSYFRTLETTPTE